MKNIIKVVSFAGATVLSSASASSLTSVNPYDAIMDAGPVAERSTTEVLTDCASYAVEGIGTRGGLRVSSKVSLATVGIAGVVCVASLATPSAALFGSGRWMKKRFRRAEDHVSPHMGVGKAVKKAVKKLGQHTSTDAYGDGDVAL